MTARYTAKPIVRGKPVATGQIKAASLTALLAAVAANGKVPLYELYKVAGNGELVSLGKGRGSHDQPSRQR